MNLSRKVLSGAFLLLLAMTPLSKLYAQFEGDVYRAYNNATVLNTANAEIRMPWAGGLNNPQLAMGDLNNDGKQDIAVFEEHIGVRTFIATGNGTYKYDAGYQEGFPKLRSYMKLLDYNRDDIPDLFHFGGAGVSISTGYYKDNKIHFKYYRDIFYNSKFSGWTNAYVEPVDIPAIDDIDGDGDLDILAYGVWGSRIYLYRNCQVEDNLPADSFKVCVADVCWGRYLQFFERNMVLHDSAKLCNDIQNNEVTCSRPGRSTAKTTHAGNTLLMIDMDADGDMDILNANVSFPDVQYVQNGRVENSYHVDSAIAQDTLWGSNGVDLFMPMFPASFYLDVDHDGDRDLLFSPKGQYSENYKSISYYENTSSSNVPNFVFRKNTYLIDQMIDMGTGAYPYFYDVDKDGKEDLLIGSDGFYDHSVGGNVKSQIAYYRNVSSGLKKFEFKLVTRDFLGLSAADYKGTSIAIGDVDNDNIDDLIIGHTDGTMSLYKNHAAYDTVMPDWKLEAVTMVGNSGQTIDVGDYATPCLYDLDKDGRKDLISGNQTGTLVYYHNNSATPGLADFKKTEDSLGGVVIYKRTEPYGYSAPYIGRMDDKQKDFLVVGSKWGELYRFDGFQNGATKGYKMVDSAYSYINIGSRSTPAFANLDNDADSLYELVLGSELGGVHFYRQDYPATIESNNIVDNDIEVYPNPTKDIINISWSKAAEETVNLKVVSIEGRVVAQKSVNAGARNATISLSNVSAGVYYLVVQTNSVKVAKTISVVK